MKDYFLIHRKKIKKLRFYQTVSLLTYFPDQVTEVHSEFWDKQQVT